MFSLIFSHVSIRYIVEDASSGIFSPFPFRPQDSKFYRNWLLKTPSIFLPFPDVEGMVCFCRMI